MERVSFYILLKYGEGTDNISNYTVDCYFISVLCM